MNSCHYREFASIQMLLHNRMTNVNARQNDGATALTVATRLAIEGVMQELITADADVNATDGYGRSNDDVSMSSKADTLLSLSSRFFFVCHFSDFYLAVDVSDKLPSHSPVMRLPTRNPSSLKSTFILSVHLRFRLPFLLVPSTSILITPHIFVIPSHGHVRTTLILFPALSWIFLQLLLSL